MVMGYSGWSPGQLEVTDWPVPELGAHDVFEIARNENHLGFRASGTQIFTRLIEGPYPNYEQVIPKDNDKTLVADRAALNSAIRRMAIVASDQTHRSTPLAQA